MRDETELEGVRRARDTVLANISHEFRTPLAAQLASIELLQDGLASMSREQLAELVESLQRGTLRLTWLIDNLLESVRIESGQLTIRRQPVSLPQVIEDAAELVAGLRTQRNQTLEVDLPDSLPQALGDGGRLTQVFVNLLANAIQVRSEGGTIRVGAAPVDGQLEVWVEDEGPGVPEPERDSIFERFHRSGEEEPSRAGWGSVSGSCARSSSVTEAASPSAGRTIRARVSRSRFPSLERPHEDPDRRRRPRPALAGRFRVAPGGVRRRRGADVNAALRVYFDESPELAILDINLPGGSGFAICKAIRAHSRIPVMMLTVRGEEEDLVQALELGADDYLTNRSARDAARAREGALAPRRHGEPADRSMRAR
jgi:CheY-like chemotaxis protein